MMSLPENIKTVVEMKTLQAEEKEVQVQKMMRQAQLEPLQEKAEQLVVEIDATKLSVECKGSGRRRVATKPSHRATRGRYGRKEQPGSGAVPENHLKCMMRWHKQ
jgi:hypothetical protein